MTTLSTPPRREATEARREPTEGAPQRAAAPGRNAYAELLRDTRGLRREQQQARDAWFAKLAAEKGVDTASLAGTGRDGRVTKGDVLAYLETRVAAPAAVIEERGVAAAAVVAPPAPAQAR